MLLKVPARRKLVISLTPLIDVVFILLVFFMLASNFVDWREYEVTTQVSANAEPSEPPPISGESGESKTATLQIRDEGSWVLDGEVLTSRVSGHRKLRERLKETPDLTVVVQPADSVPMQSTMDAFDTVRKVGVKTVSLKPFANSEAMR